MCYMKYGVFNLVRDCNLKAVMYALVFFIFKTHCIYVYYLVFYGQSLIPKYKFCILYLVLIFKSNP